MSSAYIQCYVKKPYGIFGVSKDNWIMLTTFFHVKFFFSNIQNQKYIIFNWIYFNQQKTPKTN